MTDGASPFAILTLRPGDILLVSLPEDRFSNPIIRKPKSIDLAALDARSLPAAHVEAIRRHLTEDAAP